MNSGGMRGGLRGMLRGMMRGVMRFGLRGMRGLRGLRGGLPPNTESDYDERSE